MSRAYAPYIAALAALWGASYMFIKVADRDFAPTTMILIRLVLSAALVFAVVAARRGAIGAVADMRRLGWQGFGLGIVNGAIPFTLIAWSEKHIDSGVAAIANATMPIFVVLLAVRWQPSERVGGLRLGGFLLGLVGVGILAGIHPRGGWWVAAGSMVGGAVVLLPLGLAQLPGRIPGWKETGSVLALAVLGTALAQILLYRVLRTDGAARVSLVTYLLPVTALFYGVTLLGEPVTVQELVGMVLILGGVAVGSGAVRMPRREPAAATPAP